MRDNNSNIIEAVIEVAIIIIADKIIIMIIETNNIKTETSIKKMTGDKINIIEVVNNNNILIINTVAIGSSMIRGIAGNNFHIEIIIAIVTNNLRKIKVTITIEVVENTKTLTIIEIVLTQEINITKMIAIKIDNSIMIIIETGIIIMIIGIIITKIEMLDNNNIMIINHIFIKPIYNNKTIRRITVELLILQKLKLKVL